MDWSDKSTEVAPSTGIEREEVNVAAGLLERPVGKVVDPD
jgi:hypothetical protein